MAECAFDIPFTGSATALFERAKAGIESRGGTLTGDATSGTVIGQTPIGRMAGTYRISGQVAHFEITQKPFLVSCALIQSELAKLGAQMVPAETRAKPAPRSRRATPAKRSVRSPSGRIAPGKRKVLAKRKMKKGRKSSR